jgi:hypothetical protein
MNAVLSYLISAGIIVFGLWIVTCSIEAGLPIGIMLTGILPVAIGSISFYGAIRGDKLAQ